MANLSKAEIAERYKVIMCDGVEIEVSKRLRKEVVDFFFNEIVNMAEEKPTVIQRLGKFERRVKTARPGRNPKKKDEIHIVSARSVFICTPSSKLIERLRK